MPVIQTNMTIHKPLDNYDQMVTGLENVGKKHNKVVMFLITQESDKYSCYIDGFSCNW